MLATPQLTARSSSAKFQAGGEIPYSVVNQDGFVTEQFKNFGIILEVKPRADSTGAIRSEILAEVSEPDASVSTLQGAWPTHAPYADGIQRPRRRDDGAIGAA